MPTRILFVSHTATHKGSAVSLYQLMRNLDQSRYQPLAVYSKPGPMVERLQRENIPVWVLKKRGLFGLGLIREALALIRSQGVRLVHLNSAVPFCRYVGIAARLAGVPVVWHIREDPAGKRVRRLKPWIRLLANRILVVSAELARSFSYTGKALHIPNGVDLSMFHPDIDGKPFRQKYGLHETAFIFGVVGSIEERKGQLVFLEAAKPLVQQFPDMRLLIVGSGLQEEEQRITDYLAANPSLAGVVGRTGRLQNIPEVMAALDVVVLPSTWEGFPRAVIEALAAGCPVIATPVGDVPEIISDGEQGYLVPINAPEALSHAMARCMSEQHQLESMQQAALDRARKFSIQAHVDMVQACYEALLYG